MPLPNFNGQGPIGGAAQSLGLILDGTSPDDQLEQKKKKLGQAQRMPNMPGPYSAAASSLLSDNGNQY